MNNVGLTGRITKDLELKYTQNGKAYCRFTLAVDRGLSKKRNKKQKRTVNQRWTL